MRSPGKCRRKSRNRVQKPINFSVVMCYHRVDRDPGELLAGQGSAGSPAGIRGERVLSRGKKGVMVYL